MKTERKTCKNKGNSSCRWQPNHFQFEISTISNPIISWNAVKWLNLHIHSFSGNEALWGSWLLPYANVKKQIWIFFLFKLNMISGTILFTICSLTLDQVNWVSVKPEWQLQNALNERAGSVHNHMAVPFERCTKLIVHKITMFTQLIFNKGLKYKAAETDKNTHTHTQTNICFAF